MVNLESAITQRGSPDPKELEAPADRYWFRTSPAALDVLAAAGVDVVTMANNHGADYGAGRVWPTRCGRAARPGRRRRRRPGPPGRVHAVPRHDPGHRHRLPRRRRIAAGGIEPDLGRGPDDAGHRRGPPRGRGRCWRRCGGAPPGRDVVVVYLHWGLELQSCPTRSSRDSRGLWPRPARTSSSAATRTSLLGSGWLGDTYVDYGLGNFVWYHDHQAETGVLRLTVRDGEVVRDGWVPARIQASGLPCPAGRARRGRTRSVLGGTCARAPASPPHRRADQQRRPGVLLVG